ncbi:hypothetical protein PsorP6_000685 [Peronosclerospora sorghi]|uniref:Uncharacterized protein n=1 Tax=Peronosclerospora sorghi TaxID=230839 RepID=A0ACC0WXD8_9STRA|nr:hypothetical protein PsorP6_000685 [Peronosclerospora sorghi]
MTPYRREADYIPPPLRRLVFHSQDEFYLSHHFDPHLVAHLMYEGFLPIATEWQDQYFLLPKLHRSRSVLLLTPETPPHVPKSVRKRGKKYCFVLNRDVDAVIAGCHEQHGVPWLYPPMVATFRALFHEGIHVTPEASVHLVTVEVYDVATHALVAGELGYTVGTSYTSLTGFTRAKGAGTVQLHALGCFLARAGCTMWDLGMAMEYKTRLGAQNLDRDAFLALLYKGRTQTTPFALTEKSKATTSAREVDMAIRDLFTYERRTQQTRNESKEHGGHGDTPRQDAGQGHDTQADETKADHSSTDAR